MRNIKKIGQFPCCLRHCMIFIEVSRGVFFFFQSSMCGRRVSEWRKPMHELWRRHLPRFTLSQGSQLQKLFKYISHFILHQAANNIYFPHKDMPFSESLEFTKQICVFLQDNEFNNLLKDSKIKIIMHHCSFVSVIFLSFGVSWHVVFTDVVLYGTTKFVILG